MAVTQEPAKPVLLSAVLFAACPATPLVVGGMMWNDPLPFIATVVVHLATLVYMAQRVRAWRRPGPPARPFGYGFASAALAAAASALALVSVLGHAYGVRGSALPRLRTGLATSVDLAYLGAVAVTVAAIVSALGLLVLLALSRQRDNAVGRLSPRAHAAGVARHCSVRFGIRIDLR